MLECLNISSIFHKNALFIIIMNEKKVKIKRGREGQNEEKTLKMSETLSK